MSMSTNVTAFRDMDGQFKAMLEAKLFCDERGLSYPVEVDQYFRGEANESDTYLRDEMLEVDIEPCLREWHDEYSSRGYELDVACIPAEVKTIRFFNSW